MKTRFVACMLAAALGLGGCTTLAPEYARPAAPVPTEWPTGAAYTGSAGKDAAAAADLAWQDFFENPQLNQVVRLALDNNRDLRVAALNIERSRAQYQIQRAGLLPQVDATASGSSQRVPSDLSGTGAAVTTHRYSVGLGVSAYELDLFGRVRSLKQQALSRYLATEQARRSVQIGLVAEVALNYLILAADKQGLAIARETVTSQQASYDLTRRRFDAGVASALELNQARTSIETARVDIARYTTLVAQDENALELVVGAPLPAELLTPGWADLQAAMQSLSPGLSSDVLLLRPDILQAENQLMAANANIGAARAAFFPRITLVGSVGTASAELSGLFDSGSHAWSFAPQVSLPIFDAGRNKASLQVAEADRQIAVARYEQAIQTAFREVSDALARQGTIGEQLAAQQSLTEATAESYRLSRTRYEKGVDSYLEVLDSQRAMYAAQQNLVATQFTRLANLATLYRVLGGGWNESL